MAYLVHPPVRPRNPVHRSISLSLPTQREQDTESSLMHYRARSHDPRLGRFVQKEPEFESLVELHYAYAENQPTFWQDPTGWSVEANATLGLFTVPVQAKPADARDYEEFDDYPTADFTADERRMLDDALKELGTSRVKTSITYFLDYADTGWGQRSTVYGETFWGRAKTTLYSPVFGHPAKWSVAGTDFTSKSLFLTGSTGLALMFGFEEFTADTVTDKRTRAAVLLHEMAHTGKIEEKRAYVLHNYFLRSKNGASQQWFGSEQFKPDDWDKNWREIAGRLQVKQWTRFVK